jgi:hypothetical protein
MTLPKLILDTSACSRIARSAHRSQIETALDSKFRRVVSVQTFWELLQQIEGGDGSHFNADREVIKVAVGASRPPFFLPNPLGFAIETVLKMPRPSVSASPKALKQTYELILKARTRDELYAGVPVIRGLRQVRQFDPEVVKQQQDEGEQFHVYRLKEMKRIKWEKPTPEKWARAMMVQTGLALSDQQAAELGRSLDAAYLFDMQVWKDATAPNSSYNPERHKNDWTDLQQTIYLCDPSIRLITADRPLLKKIAASEQAVRAFYLPDYLQRQGLLL